MIKKDSVFHFLTYLTMALLLWFTYNSIISLGFDNETSSPYAAITNLIVVLLSVLVLFISANKCQSSFSMFWLFWSIWLFVDFFILGLKGSGVADYFHVTFCPMVFVMFYTMSLYSDKVKSIVKVGFLIIYALSVYLILMNLRTIQYLSFDEEMGHTNLVFWCLCILPVLMSYEKKWMLLTFVLITAFLVLITGKRSAFIIIMLLVAFYVFYSSKRSRRGWYFLGVLIIGFILYLLINNYFLGSFYEAVERMRNIREDEGSGRIDIYWDVINTMNDNTFFAWIFGNGCSTIRRVGHSCAHNDALQMLFEYGVIGLAFYVIMLIMAIKRMLILRKHNSSYYLGYFTSVCITVVLGMVSNLIVFFSYFAFICAYWGIVEAKMMQSGQLKRIVVT